MNNTEQTSHLEHQDRESLAFHTWVKGSGIGHITLIKALLNLSFSDETIVSDVFAGKNGNLKVTEKMVYDAAMFMNSFIENLSEDPSQPEIQVFALEFSLFLINLGYIDGVHNTSYQSEEQIRMARDGRILDLESNIELLKNLRNRYRELISEFPQNIQSDGSLLLQ